MKSILQDFINSRAGMALGLWLSRMPPGMGYRVADWVGSGIASIKTLPIVRGVRANQWMIRGENLSSRELDMAVAATFQSVVRSLYEFWHFYNDPEAIKNMVDFDPSFANGFERARKAGTGLLMVVPHLSNFDMVGRAAVLNGFPLHILSYPHPSDGYKKQNDLRALPGLRITPMSVDALHQASETLRSGGAVVTGGDRPLPETDSKYRLSFFGRPANLPFFYIRLAIKHRLPVVVIGGLRKPDGRYFVWSSEPIPMIPDHDLIQETVQNAESVLSVLSSYIQKGMDQWAMFYPVWPEILHEVPM